MTGKHEGKVKFDFPFAEETGTERHGGASCRAIPLINQEDAMTPRQLELALSMLERNAILGRYSTSGCASRRPGPEEIA